MVENIQNFIKRHKTLFALLFLAVLVCIVFLPVVVNKQTFFSAIPGLGLEDGPYGFKGLKTPWTLDPGAYMWQELPLTVFWYNALQHGIFAFWNPYQGTGQPLSGAILSAVYNPIKLTLFSVFPYLKTFDFYFLLRILIAGFGTYLFLKKIRLSEQASLLGGVAFMFSGYFMQWVVHWSLAADMMIPFILLGIEKLFEHPRFLNVLFVSIATAIMVLSMSPEAVITVLLLVLAYFIFRFFSGPRDWRVVRRFICALVLAFLITLPMLWDVALFFNGGVNAHAGASASLLPSDLPLTLGRALQVFLPPSLFLEIARVGGLYQNNFVVPYLGTFLLILACAAVSFRRDAGRLRIFAVFFGLYALLFLLKVAELPPVQWVSFLPLVNKVIFLKYMGTFYFSAAVLAAIGFHGMKEGLADKRRVKIFLASLAALLAFVFLISNTFRQLYVLRFDAGVQEIQSQLSKLPAVFGAVFHILETYPFAYLAFLVVLNAFLVALFFFLWRRKKTILIFAVLFLELFLYMPKVRDGGLKPWDPFREPPFVAFLKSQPDINSYRIFAFGKILAPQVASAYGLRDIRASDPVYLKNYISYYSAILKPEYRQKIFSCWCTLVEPEEMDEKAPEVLRAGSVKYLISEGSLPKSPDYTLLYDKELKIYAITNALPLTYLKVGGKTMTTVKILAYEPNRIVLEADAPENGKLVLNDSFYPGWEASIDGTKTNIISEQGLFKEIAVPQGIHRIIFSYSPFSEEAAQSLLNLSRPPS